MIFLFLALMFGPFTSETTYNLVAKAMEAQSHAYCPYSCYKVGAAVITNKGKVYTGCNIENASYGLTICAERVAIFNAVAAGETHVDGIAIVTRNGGMACGACRQVLNEFNPNMTVITADETGIIRACNNLEYYLPNSFGMRQFGDSE